MKEIKVGIIGMGKMGLLHTAILNSLPGTKVKAVVDTEKLVTSFLKNAQGIESYNDYKKMIEESKIDAVYITTPVASHVPIASFCAKKNLHFFVEKPLGRTAEESTELCNIIKNTKIISMVGFYLRYAETFVKAKELLENNVLGEIINIKSSVYQSQSLAKSSGWRFKKKESGGGVLIDLGIHLIDLLRWYFGNITSVKGAIEFHYSQEVEDTVTSTIEFENGMNCLFEASWNVKNYRLQETTIEIEGTYGNMRVNEDSVKLDYKGNNKKQDEIFYRQSLYQGVPIDIGGSEYTREDLNFIECIRNEKQPILNVINSNKTQSVIDAIYRSSKSNKIEVVTYIE
jgi:predicted dehydrogenase